VCDAHRVTAWLVFPWQIDTGQKRSASGLLGTRLALGGYRPAANDTDQSQGEIK